MAGSSSGSQDSEGEIYKIIGHGGGQRRDRGDTGVRELGTLESLCHSTVIHLLCGMISILSSYFISLFFFFLSSPLK